MQMRNVTLGERDDVHAGEGEALEESGCVLLVAAESIERIGQDDVESSVQRVPHQRLEAGAKQGGAGDRVIGELLNNRPILARSELAAYPELVRNRRVALIVRRVPGVDGDFQCRVTSSCVSRLRCDLTLEPFTRGLASEDADQHPQRFVAVIARSTLPC